MSQVTKKKKQSKPRLSSLTKERPESFSPIEAQKLAEGEPIVPVILYTAMLENTLESVISSKFRHQDQDTLSHLTDGSGPLGTFHQKIEIGYALGIYDDSTRRSLQIIRKIRNVFAHAQKPVAIDHPLLVSEFKKIDIFRRKTDRKIRSCIENGQYLLPIFIITCFSLYAVIIKRQSEALKSKLRRLNKKYETVFSTEPLAQLMNSKTEPPNGN